VIAVRTRITVLKTLTWAERIMFTFLSRSLSTVPFDGRRSSIGENMVLRVKVTPTEQLIWVFVFAMIAGPA
jgi:hypothetical protein